MIKLQGRGIMRRAGPSTSGRVTRVAVSPGRPIGPVDRKLFGGFIEHLGRCIYGGVYDQGSPLSDENGFRRDVLALLRDLQLGVLRWPGGNFVSNYHWTDGIGPKDRRPRRAELAWGGEEPNQFGTDDFLRYCAALGTEPYICLNMGTGSLDQALAWVEYCNSAGQTAWAQRRRDNGRAEPYPVTYWGLGNEMYGDWQVGALSAEEYVRAATRWARAIRLIDPRAKLVSCGKDGWSDWDRIVIDGLAALTDYHAIHLYTGSDDYWTNVLQPHQAERAISCTRAFISQAAYLQEIGNPPRIAYDEWNVWYRTKDGALEERYSFADALAVGTYLNIFVRNCDWVKMANLAQMVNAIAPIVTTPDTAVTQPIYYPFLLHTQAALDLAVDAYVSGPEIELADADRYGRRAYGVEDLGPFTLVDAAATSDTPRRRVSVVLINRNPDHPEPAEIVLRDTAFDGPAQLRTLTQGAGPASPAFPGIDSVRLEEGTENPSGSTVAITLPPASMTAITAALS
jgi:alpha-N-arabinofuranosidase